MSTWCDPVPLEHYCLLRLARGRTSHFSEMPSQASCRCGKMRLLQFTRDSHFHCWELLSLAFLVFGGGEGWGGWVWRRFSEWWWCALIGLLVCFWGSQGGPSSLSSLWCCISSMTIASSSGMSSKLKRNMCSLRWQDAYSWHVHVKPALQSWMLWFDTGILY